MLLELVVDPTCSVVLERQPPESDIMERKPRALKENILNKETLLKSVIQGLAIFIASFGLYYTTLNNTGNIEVARTMGICLLVLASLFLVQVNSSGINSVIYSLKRLIKDKVMWGVTIGTILIIGAVVYTPLSGVLRFTHLSLREMATVIVLSAVSVFWYEIVKLIIRKKNKKKKLREVPIAQ